MIINIAVKPSQVKGYTRMINDHPDRLYGFPFFSIDKDSYIVSAQIQTGIDFDVAGGRHCIAVGRGCALADSITFMVDLNHDYAAVSQGELSFLQGTAPRVRIRRKGSVIIQNDVWVGHGATILSGVTLHNGCVVAAEAVVTKDVPPYAIVGGNPARILRYRFDEETIAGLQKIAWWDWPEPDKAKRAADFRLPVEEFVRKYLPAAEAGLEKRKIVPPPPHTYP